MKKLSQIVYCFVVMIILMSQEVKGWHLRWFWSWPWYYTKVGLDESPQPDMSHYKHFEDYDDENYCPECKVPQEVAEDFQESIINWVYHKNLRNYEPE